MSAHNYYIYSPTITIAPTLREGVCISFPCAESYSWHAIIIYVRLQLLYMFAYNYWVSGGFAPRPYPCEGIYIRPLLQKFHVRLQSYNYESDLHEGSQLKSPSLSSKVHIAGLSGRQSMSAYNYDTCSPTVTGLLEG